MDVKAGIDTKARLDWAEAALHAAGTEAARGGERPADFVQPDGWRWRVLKDLTGLSVSVKRDYDQATRQQSREAWKARAGPVSTGFSSAFGALLAALGAGLIKGTGWVGWALAGAGVLIAVFGSVVSANNYARHRNQSLRFLRLLHDIWDFAYLVLPTAAPADAFTELAALRTQWETAGS